MSHLIDALTGLIQNLYVVTGLVGIAMAMAIESCCIPLPSEIIMPLAGAMLALSNNSGAKHLLGINPSWPVWLSLLLIALAGSLGALVGSIAAYGIGYAGGRPLILKYGKYVLISQHDADQADRFFQRWGSATAFFSRLLPVVRTYISLPAGITKMPFGRFCIYTFLGSLPWCFALSLIGYQLGNNYDKISGPLHYFDAAIVVAVILLVVLYVWRHIRNDRRARAEQNALNTEGQSSANVQNRQPFQPQQPQEQAFARPTFQGQAPQSPTWNQGQPPVQQNWRQPQPPQGQQPQWGRSTSPVQPPQENSQMNGHNRQ